MFIEVTETPLFLDPLLKAVSRPSCGAVAFFVGIVREPSRGRNVLYLAYEAYQEMAEDKMREIAEAIKARWPVEEVAIVHRMGRLEIGEASVIVAVSAPHRREALEACAYGIERVKEIVPIWKKEVWEGGEEWIMGS
ncbi:MAG: molybdenum cofactor biosynthesis protein MoaE [candidate division NC10 bacterium]|nr:molybdenum cofactor biosynthesis protein MoaE [candidate division NC10 bacterium]